MVTEVVAAVVYNNFIHSGNYDAFLSVIPHAWVRRPSPSDTIVFDCKRYMYLNPSFNP